MPYYKKRKLAKFIKAVIDNEAETKRLIQTSEKCWTMEPYQSIQGINRQDGNASDWFGTSGRENFYCWALHSNTPSFWPVKLHPLAKGFSSGYAPDQYGAITNALHDNDVRIGSEVKIKGISLEFMTWLKPQLPFGAIKVSLIRHAKDDHPVVTNLYKNYTAVKPLDMMDTRRFKVLKTWNFKHYQSQPTTAGSETASQMFTGNNMNTDAYDGPKAILSDTDKTMAEWLQYIEEVHPDYMMMSWDDLPSYWSNIQFFLDKTGYSSAVSTGILKFNWQTTETAGGQHSFGVVHDDYNGGDQNRYIAAMIEDLGAGLSRTYVKQQYSTTPTVGAKQVWIIKKGFTAGSKGPTQDQIMIPMDKKHKLWVPGYLLGPGGSVRFKEQPDFNDDTSDRDGFYDHVLMFETYANFKTWSYDTAAGGTYPEVFRISDFLQVTYFKDF